MEAFSSATQKVQEEGEREDPVVYVEELGGEGDYWLSITDAARVCRVQDVSIRRAIARGALPVRRQRAGQNKRTRFVRASDLPSVGFPIIDESAAITTEIGKADILSIPRQQQRIQQDHQVLMARLQEIQQTLESSQASLLAQLQKQQEEAQAGLQALREEQIRQLASTEASLRQEADKLQQSLSVAEQRLDQELQAMLQALTQEREETLAREASLREVIGAQKETLEGFQQKMQQTLMEIETRQQQQWQAYQRAVITQFQQAEQETHARITALAQQFTAQLEEQARKDEEQYTALARQIIQLQQGSDNLSRGVAAQQDEQTRILEQQKTQGEQLARLLPLLPYARQTLLTEQDRLTWMQAFANLEQRLIAEQQHELARYQPLLDLLSPEHLASLARLLDEKTSSQRQA